jgi:Tol biopolymer transport system component
MGVIMLSRAFVTGFLIFATTPVLTAKERILLNRIGPSQSTLFIAKVDGSDERPLLAVSGFDYNASFSSDGKWIVFTSERNGSADIYRVRVDGTGLERLTDDPAYDDQAVLSPDGEQLAFVSTRGAGTADIWLLDLRAGKARNLTNGSGGNFRRVGPQMASGSRSPPTATRLCSAPPAVGSSYRRPAST